MRRIILFSVSALFVFCGLSLAQGAEEKSFNYEQKTLNKEISKDLKVKVAVYVPQEALKVELSPFNPEEPKEGQEKDIKVDISLDANKQEVIKRQPDKKILTGLLVDKLAAENKFILVERKDINAILQEINFQQSKWVSSAEAVKIGNLYGVKYIIISEFLRNEPGTEVSEANHTVTLRMCELQTGRIAASGMGQASTIDAAISQAVTALSDKVKSQPWSCLVARVEADSVYLNAGYDEGLEKNMVLGVYKEKDKIVDPLTQEVLGFNNQKIGKVKITDVLGADLSRAKILEKAEPISVGSIVQAKDSTNQGKNLIDMWNKSSAESIKDLNKK